MTKLLHAGAELIPGESGDPAEISVSGTGEGRATIGTLGLVARAEHVTRAEVEHWLNVMLGHDPEHSPPHLGWEHLGLALKAEGIETSQEQLMALPFAFEFSPDLAPMLDTDPGPPRGWSFRPL